MQRKEMQMKLIEKILTNKEHCEKIAEMSLEEFQAALAQRGLEGNNAEKIYSAVKTSLVGGELDDDDLAMVAGGGLCFPCSCDSNC